MSERKFFICNPALATVGAASTIDGAIERAKEEMGAYRDIDEVIVVEVCCVVKRGKAPIIVEGV